MIADHLTHPYDAMGPEHLAMLQRVFDRSCAASKISKGTPQAESLAALLFRLFQEGIRDEDKLDEKLAQKEFV